MRIWNNHAENSRRLLVMLCQFEGNRLKFGILYCKNWISRILQCENLNSVAKIQPSLSLNIAPHSATKWGGVGLFLTTKTSTNHMLQVIITWDYKTWKIPLNSPKTFSPHPTKLSSLSSSTSLHLPSIFKLHPFPPSRT